MNRRRFAAFTLIELLVVVAIISILAAIAIPNMIDSQTRAKVSRAKADLHALATAFETYALDHNRYPHAVIDQNECTSCTGGYGGIANCPGLTTPVTYIDLSQVTDPFLPVRKLRDYRMLVYGKSYYFAKTHSPNQNGRTGYALYSMGPGQRIVILKGDYLEKAKQQGIKWLTPYSYHVLFNQSDWEFWVNEFTYDPTNGLYACSYITKIK